MSEHPELIPPNEPTGAVPLGALDATSIGKLRQLPPICGATGPDGYPCTTEPGHDGWHRTSHPESGAVLDTWPQEDNQ